MSYPLHCCCEAVRAELDLPTRVNRVVCYCHSCQAFAYFLGREADVLDQQGGSDIVQVRPASLNFARGAEHIACVRLTQKGTMRWYAKCCRTPIGNTVANPRVSFIGLIYPFVAGSREERDAAFGPVTGRVFTDGARGEPRPSAMGFARSVAKMAAIVLGARISGAYRRTPFFRRDGIPIATPYVLTVTEYADVMGRVRAPCT